MKPLTALTLIALTCLLCGTAIIISDDVVTICKTEAKSAPAGAPDNQVMLFTIPDLPVPVMPPQPEPQRKRYQQ